MTSKRILYVNRRAPYGTGYAQEALEVVLIGGAFGQDVGVLFLDDGVFQLKAGQAPGGLGIKNVSPAFRALEMYDIDNIYVDQTSLVERGLCREDLIVPVEILDGAGVTALVETQDVVLTF